MINILSLYLNIWFIHVDLQVAYLIVDEMHAEHPELVKDQFWDEGIPDELPYTIAAEEFRQVILEKRFFGMGRIGTTI